MTTPTRTVRRPTWIVLPLGLALVGALALSPVLAQDTAPNEPDAPATAVDARARHGAFVLRQGPDGAIRARGPQGGVWFGAPRGAVAERLQARFDARGDERRGDGFARWLDADPAAGPVVPGLVGRVADGTTVRLVFYDGPPDDGGTELVDLTLVAGESNVAAFRDDVRAAAEGATHVVVDVLGRVVALPEAANADDVE